MHLHMHCFCVLDILAWHMPSLGDCGVLIANLALNSYRGVLANWVNFKRDYAEAGRRGGIMSCIAVIRGFYISIFLSYHRSLARTHIRQYCCSNAVLLKSKCICWVISVGLRKWSIPLRKSLRAAQTWSRSSLPQTEREPACPQSIEVNSVSRNIEFQFHFAAVVYWSLWFQNCVYLLSRKSYSVRISPVFTSAKPYYSVFIVSEQ